MSSWQALSSEIEQWQQPIQLWWRDDDATANSQALQRMLKLAHQYQVPVHLAVIPQLLEPSLDIIKQPQHRADCYVLQHGYDHKSYALAEQRKIELGGSQSVTTLTAKLSGARESLAAHFGTQYIDILVPPWNRISPALAEHLPEIGYRQLSVLASPKVVETDFLVNVHIDIIDWKQRSFAGESIVLEKIRQYLYRTRTTNLDSAKPCGIMTHHLDHDEQCWAFIEQFLVFCQQHSNIQWLSGSALYQ